jgi:tetratricopeptide (TPR) repeat protein/predicted Ser/Thr protein kinase
MRPLADLVRLSLYVVFSLVTVAAWGQGKTDSGGDTPTQNNSEALHEIINNPPSLGPPTFNAQYGKAPSGPKEQTVPVGDVLIPPASKTLANDINTASQEGGNGLQAIGGSPGRIIGGAMQIATLSGQGNGISANGTNGVVGGAHVSPTVLAGSKILQTDPVKADLNFQQALAQNPNDTAALAGHIQALSAQGQRADATASAQRLLTLEPTNKLAQQIVAQSANVDHAEGITQKFKKLTEGLLHGPQDDGAAVGKVLAMSALAGAGGSPGAAGAGVEGLGTVRSLGAQGQVAMPTSQVMTYEAQRLPSQFAPLVLHALEKERVGDFTSALLDAIQATDMAPGDAAAWTVRAEIDNHLQNYPAGIKDAGTAIALAPGNARALRARAFAELESGQFDQALADATTATSLDPASGIGFLYKAMAEDRLGRTDEAAQDLRKAVALDGSLAPLASPMMSKLGLSSTASGGAKSHLLRGGLIVVSLALVLFGLLGTRRGRELTRRFTTTRPGGPNLGAALNAPLPELTTGSMLGDTYRIVREIGRGGMGVVYEGRDETLQRRVAIKRLIQDEQTTSADFDRFLREARLVAQLKHPNVAEIYTLLPGREAFLIFEYIDGKTLDEALRVNRVLPMHAARKVVREVASALTSAHAQGIIHRDLKPSNVMLAADGSAKVMDFGIAHQARTAATRHMTQTIACGTPPYMAPEQGMGSVSKASDIYALGVMAYELVTGVRPFEGPDYLEQKLQKRYVPASQRSTAASAALDQLFAQVFDPDPTKRPSDAAAFADAFDRAADSTPRRQASSV